MYVPTKVDDTHAYMMLKLVDGIISLKGMQVLWKPLDGRLLCSLEEEIPSFKSGLAETNVQCHVGIIDVGVQLHVPPYLILYDEGVVVLQIVSNSGLLEKQTREGRNATPHELIDELLKSNLVENGSVPVHGVRTDHLHLLRLHVVDLLQENGAELWGETR